MFIAGIYKHGSVWISGDYRPEDMTENSQYLYAENEPNGSGKCFYLSASRYHVLKHQVCEVFINIAEITHLFLKSFSYLKAQKLE